MRGRSLPWKALPPVAVAASQLGHLLVYSVRLGPASVPSPGPNAHAYLPGLITALAGLSGGLVVFVLAVLAAARVLGSGGTRAFGRTRPPVLDLAAVLFVSQVAIFAVQETAEGLVTVNAAPSAAAILLWGTLGQLPVAPLAALALSWLAGVREAMTELSRARVAMPLPLGPAPPAGTLVAGPGRPVAAWSSGRVRSQRAPPPNLR